MKMKRTAVLNILMAGAFIIATSVMANAQATRTWISGVGDDANPCSRTAPCKTLQGTISKTAAGGEINAIDAGGFGGVTITKSITIDLSNVLGGVLVSGSNAIIINDSGASSIVVNLRGIDFDGLNTGLSGVKIMSAKTVNIQNCQIYGFTASGVSDERTAGGGLFISDTTIRNNTPAAVSMLAVSTPALYASFDNVKFISSGTGLTIASSNSAAIFRSTLSDNVTQGILANGTSEVAIEDCFIANNSVGISLKTGTGIVRLSNTTITKNGTGLKPGTGSILSYTNNKISGNGVENPPTGSILVQ